VDRFRLLCDGKPFGPAASEGKRCQVVLARIQGSDFSHLAARKGAKKKPKAMPLMVSSKMEAQQEDAAPCCDKAAKACTKSDEVSSILEAAMLGGLQISPPPGLVLARFSF